VLPVVLLAYEGHGSGRPVTLAAGTTLVYIGTGGDYMRSTSEHEAIVSDGPRTGQCVFWIDDPEPAELITTQSLDA
jgi:hypothetical protein